MSNPIAISNGGVVVIHDSNVIINGIPPVSISWVNSLDNIYIYNSTSNNIPVTGGLLYYDRTGTLTNIIPAGLHLQLVKYTDGSYHDLSGSDINTVTNINITGNSNNVTSEVPIATTLIPGIVKPDGVTITVDPDGSIHASGSLSQVQSDWNETNPVLPDFIKNKPTFTQVQSDWNETNPALPDFILNKPSIPSPYVLPAASPSVRGGIKVGSGLSITGDVLNTLPSGMTQLTGDGSAGPGAGSQVLTLTSVNPDVGTFGDATNVPQIDVDAKGRILSIVNVPISAGGGGINQLTGDATAGPGSGSQPLTLATVNSNVGTWGDGTHVPMFTVDGKGRITGVASVPISGGPASTSMPIASSLGILATGADQTAALNTVFGNANYAGIIMDYSAPAAVTINGTVNCQGKMIYFQPGSYFTGTGTLNNAILNAGMKQKCFNTTVSLTNCTPADGRISIFWYGAATGFVDSQPAIQKCFDMAVVNTGIRKVFAPAGTYFVFSPLMMYSWNGTDYQQAMISFEGEGQFWDDGQGTLIRGNNVSFILGLQLNKGSTVKHIHFQNTFTPPSLSTYNFYTCTYAAYTDGVSRDTHFSPQACIVIDPFSYLPPNVIFGGTDGGYPDMTSWYRGTGGRGGSTGCIFEDVFLANAVCGFITSPNGWTQNAELMKLTKIQIVNCKTGFVGCQDQEKLNVITHTACWGGTHTMFNFSGPDGYGYDRPGHWVVNGVNIAGRVNRLISRDSGGFFPMTMMDVYAESLGTIGTWNTGVGDCFEDSTINYVTLDTFIAYPNYPGVAHGNLTGLTIRNCQIRYYDNTNHPLVFTGGYFEGCYFFALPYGTSDMVNCSTAPNGFFNESRDLVTQNRNAVGAHLMGGHSRIFDKAEIPNGKQICMVPKNYYSGKLFSLDSASGAGSTVVVSGNVATVTPLTSMDLLTAGIGNLVFDSNTSTLLGVITAIGATTYTVSYVPNGVTSGTYFIIMWVPLTCLSFLGDTTAGSAVISNVVLDFGIPQVGQYLSIPLFYSRFSHDQQGRIIAYDSVAHTITMDRNAYSSSTAYYFSNNSAIKDILITSINDSGVLGGSGLSNTEIMPKGSYWTTDIPPNGRKVYIIKQTGYYNSLPQALWTELTA